MATAGRVFIGCGGGLAWRRCSAFRNAVFTAGGTAYLKGHVDQCNGSFQPFPSGYAAYFAAFANVGVPYVPALCARPPVAYFVAAPAGAGAVQVLASATPGPRYAELVHWAWAWAWGDGTTSTGPAPGPHTYAVPPGAGTAVTLTVTNSLGCTAAHTEYPFGPLAARPPQAGAGMSLVLWPSPSAGRTTATLGGLGAQPPAAVALLNALGQLVRQTKAPVVAGILTAELDLTGLPAGLYAVRVSTREGTAVARVVKE